MFEIDKNQQYVPVKQEDVVEVGYSVNSILVAPADHSAEPTKAFIVSSRKGSAFIFYIYLHLLNSTRGVLYRRGEELVGQKDYGKVMDEALVFLESMGFIMDRLDLRSLALADKQEYLSQQPFFPLPPEETAHDLTEEVTESEEAAAAAPAGKAGESPSQAAGPAVAPEAGPGKKTEETKAVAADQTFNLWGRVLASF